MTVPGRVTVTLADIEAAREVLDGVTVVTPMQTSRWLSTAADGSVHLKLENLQRTGSFKTRGAYLRISRLSEVERAWRDDDRHLTELQAARQITSRNAVRVLRKYFTYDAVKGRVDYRPVRPESTEGEAAG